MYLSFTPFYISQVYKTPIFINIEKKVEKKVEKQEEGREEKLEKKLEDNLGTLTKKYNELEKFINDNMEVTISNNNYANQFL